MAKSGPVRDYKYIGLQELYGIEGFEAGTARPKFGAVELDLSIGDFRETHSQEVEDGRLKLTPIDDSRIVPSPPTLLNVAWHIGLFKWANAEFDRWARDSRGKVTYHTIHPNFFEAIQIHSKNELMNMVQSLRRAMLAAQYPLYFYCVPSRILTTDPITGKLSVEEHDEILTVLPTSPAVAEHYSVSDSELRIMAPYVAFVIQRRCIHGGIRSSGRLLSTFTPWLGYLSLQLISEFIEKVEATRSSLLPKEAKKQLLEKQ